MSDLLTRLNGALEGRYRIERELGEGGMATVYLAEDLRHERKVALKVLKPELAAVVGASRFLTEIKTTANLQHPHILPLFDSGEADGFLYYVMPYVEGESLRAKLDREHQLPVDEAVDIAFKLAGALQAAHERGVIHRDVKPANILLGEREEPLVADFGIALAVQQAGGGRLTETGLSLGTPYYMSPEQAAADREPAASSDVYSLGCVLYEMLVGEPPFTGGSAQAVLARILTGSAPSPVAGRPSIPPHLDAAIRCALERLPADRFGSAEAFARALRDRTFRHGVASDEPRFDGAPWKAVAVAASGIAIAASVAAVWALGARELPARDVGLPYDRPVHLGFYRNFSVAPDASFLLYEAQTGATTELLRLDLATGTVRAVEGTAGAYGTPRISPDGARVAFGANRELRVAAIDGGGATVVAEVRDPLGGGWLDDGRIFFADADGRLLRWVDPETGPARELEAEYCILPWLSPDGASVLCGGGGEQFAFSRRLDDARARRFVRRQADPTNPTGTLLLGSDFRLVDGEYLLYMSLAGDLMGVRLVDPDSLRVSRPVTLVTDVRRENYTGVGQFEVTHNGTLVYVSGRNAAVGRLVRVRADRAIEPLALEEAAHLRYDFSPDGAALISVVQGIQEQELRAYDLASGTGQVWDRALSIGRPLWSPDRSHVVYERQREVDAWTIVGFYPNRPDGLEELFRGTPPSTYFPRGWIDADRLILGSGGGYPIASIDLAVDAPTVETLGINAHFVTLSPDGRWLAYDTDGNAGVYLMPWPEMDRRYLVTEEGGEPQWASSDELVFWSFITEASVTSTGATFYRRRLVPEADPPLTEPELIISDPDFADTPGYSYAITPGGEIVYMHALEGNQGHYFRVVPGWVERMKRAVDEAAR